MRSRPPSRLVSGRMQQGRSRVPEAVCQQRSMEPEPYAGGGKGDPSPPEGVPPGDGTAAVRAPCWVVHPLSGLNLLQAALLRLALCKAAHERLGRDSGGAGLLSIDVLGKIGVLLIGREPPPHTFEKAATDVDVRHFIAQMGAAAAAVRAVVFVPPHWRDINTVSDGGVRQLVEACPLLTSLDLSGCSVVTDGGVRAVAAACPLLTSLDLSGCSVVTDGGVRAVAAACPLLTSLDLSDCSVVTDGGVRAVAAACPQLTSLDLSGCYSKLTDDVVRVVAAACPQLTRLKYVHDPGRSAVLDEAVRALRDRGCDVDLSERG
jgi:hypothetical protein